MKTVETLNEGLKREYRLTITATDIDARVDDEVKSVAPTVRMPGFRPGKVPPNLIRKMHGEALSADALNKAIDQGVKDLKIGRASCRERGCQYGVDLGGRRIVKKKKKE